MTEAERDALDAEHDREVDLFRTHLRDALAEADEQVEAAASHLRTLASDEVFDVEVEGRRADLILAALTQARIGIAAAQSLSPAPEDPRA